MLISIQYLEPGPQIAGISSQDARARLQVAFQRLPITRVLLGWNLPRYLVDACAGECARAGAELYLWQPLLAGDGIFRPRPEWRTVGLDGRPVGGHAGLEEFTFVCPNRPAARAAVLERLAGVIAGGEYQGVFLDRIRFPSPAADPARNLACFCEDCRRLAADAGLDLGSTRKFVRRLLQTPEGRRTAVDGLFAPARAAVGDELSHALGQLLTFRQESITSIVKDAAGLVSARGLKAGLDCFSPGLAPMVGQDLAGLAAHCGWIKVMTYVRAFGPASIPFEIMGLADWLIESNRESEGGAMACLADASGWPLPASREALRHGGLPAVILTQELRQGRSLCACELLAGIELVEVPGVLELSAEQITSDSRAVLAGGPDGIVFSWDLWRMPTERLELANRLYLHFNH
jgi:hypothetical protein